MSSDIDLTVLAADTVPARHIDQFIGPWCIAEEWARDFIASTERFNLAAHENKQQAPSTEIAYAAHGIALVEIRGMMTKRGSSFSELGSTIEVRRKLQQAARSDAVDAIILKIESPGGTSAGTKELADAVRRADAVKPVIAYIEDLGASAAYYAASQARNVYANSSALVGSIGTFMVITDSSRMADDIGVVVHVVKAGEFKGSGTSGTEVTEKHLAYYQGIIDEANKEFTAAVVNGRQFTPSQLAEVANGKVYTSSDALSKGLIDGVRTFDEVVAFTRGLIMSDKPQEPMVADIKELRSALVGADSEFLMQQLDEKATLQESQEAWIVELNDRLSETQSTLQTTIANLEAANKQVEMLQSRGVEPVGAGEPRATATSAADEWNALVKKHVDAGKDRRQAVAAANREAPELREAMITEVNS